MATVSEVIKTLQEAPDKSAPVFPGGADVIAAVGDFTAGAAEDIFELTAHGLVAGDEVVLLYKAAAGVLTGISVGDHAFVSATSLTADDFSLSATSGGAVIANTADGLIVISKAADTVSVANVNSSTPASDAPGGSNATPAPGYAEIG